MASMCGRQMSAFSLSPPSHPTYPCRNAVPVHALTLLPTNPMEITRKISLRRKSVRFLHYHSSPTLCFSILSANHRIVDEYAIFHFVKTIGSKVFRPTTFSGTKSITSPQLLLNHVAPIHVFIFRIFPPFIYEISQDIYPIVKFQFSHVNRGKSLLNCPYFT